MRPLCRCRCRHSWLVQSNAEIWAQNGLPRLTRLGLPNTGACAASLRGPLQLQTWTLFPLPCCSTSIGHASFHLPNQLKDHLPPSPFWLSFLGSALTSSPL